MRKLLNRNDKNMDKISRRTSEKGKMYTTKIKE